MGGKRRITWVHFACDNHEIVFANGCLSESLLLGPMVINGLTDPDRQVLAEFFGFQQPPNAALNGRPARDCLKVNQVRRFVEKYSKERANRSARDLPKWDRDLAMEKYEAEQMHEAPPRVQSLVASSRVA